MSADEVAARRVDRDLREVAQAWALGGLVNRLDAVHAPVGAQGLSPEVRALDEALRAFLARYGPDTTDTSRAALWARGRTWADRPDGGADRG